MEKRDIFFLGGGALGAGAAGAAVVVVVLAGGAPDGIGPAAIELVSFFLVFKGAFFLATERGLNMSGLPTSLTSSSGFWPSGIEGPLNVAWFASPSGPTPSMSPSLRLENAGSAAVRRCTPGAGAVPVARDDGAGAASPVFFGGGRNEPRALNLLPPEILVRFAGGWSASGVSSGVALAAERLTRILPLPGPDERSRSFWKGFFEAAVGTGVGFCWTDSPSDSESE